MAIFRALTSGSSGGGGNVVMDLLWTNPNPTSSSAGGVNWEVQVDLTDYEAVLIASNYNTSWYDTYGWSVVKKGGTATEHSKSYPTINVATYYKDITVTDSGIKVTNARDAGTGSCVPCKIYGLKNVDSIFA